MPMLKSLRAKTPRWLREVRASGVHFPVLFSDCTHLVRRQSYGRLFLRDRFFESHNSKHRSKGGRLFGKLKQSRQLGAASAVGSSQTRTHQHHGFEFKLDQPAHAGSSVKLVRQGGWMRSFDLRRLECEMFPVYRTSPFSLPADLFFSPLTSPRFCVFCCWSSRLPSPFFQSLIYFMLGKFWLKTAFGAGASLSAVRLRSWA